MSVRIGVALSLCTSAWIGLANASPAELDVPGAIAVDLPRVDAQVKNYGHGEITHITFHHEGFGDTEAQFERALDIREGRLPAKAGAKPRAWGEVEWVENVNEDHLGKRSKSGEPLNWGMIAYNYVIARSGQVYAARPVSYAPATGSKFPGENFADFTGHLAVVVLGNYEYEEPEDVIVDQLIDFIARAQVQYRVPKGNISSHNSSLDGRRRATNCPGKHLDEMTDEIRDRAFGTALQRVLEERGCRVYGIDGRIGKNTRSAFYRLVSSVNALPESTPVSDKSLFQILDNAEWRCE